MLKFHIIICDLILRWALPSALLLLFFNNNFKKMGLKGRFSAQRAGISLWAQLMPVHTCLVYACQFSSNSVHE